MTSPKFDRAVMRKQGLLVTWSDVPGPEDQSTLLLSLLLEREPGRGVQLGVKWVRDASDSPHVFIWRSEAGAQENHWRPREAISRSAGDVAVLFPSEWMDEFRPAGAHARAVVTIDGRAVDSAQVDLDFDD